MMEEMALDYFRGLNKRDKTHLMKKIVASLNDEEKLELAKLIVKK